MRLIELNGFVRGNYLDCGACEWFRKRLGSLLKARLRTIKRERVHIWLLPMLIIERIPTLLITRKKKWKSKRVVFSHNDQPCNNVGWEVVSVICKWNNLHLICNFWLQTASKQAWHNVFPIFLYPFSGALSTFSSPVFFNSLFQSCCFFQPCGNHSLIMLAGALPRQSIGDCWTSGAKPGPSAAKIAPGHWFQTHTHSTLLPLSSSYTWPSRNGDSL